MIKSVTDVGLTDIVSSGCAELRGWGLKAATDHRDYAENIYYSAVYVIGLRWYISGVRSARVCMCACAHVCVHCMHGYVLGGWVSDSKVQIEK